QTRLEILDLAGRAVAGENDLLAAIQQSVEGMEELLLRAFFSGQKLDIVDEHHVRAAVAAAELFDIAAADGIDELVGEFFAGQIDHTGRRITAQPFLPDRLHQMGFAEAWTAMNEEWVVADAGALRDRRAGGVSELAVIAHDEAFKGVVGIEP